MTKIKNDDFQKMSFNENIEIDDYIKELSCQGCKENIFNQMAHMDIGGCLYSDPFMNEIEN